MAGCSDSATSWRLFDSNINYADHAQCHLMKIGLQGLVKLGELRPQNLSDEPFGCANHDRVAPLPIIAIGLVISYLVATRSK